MATGPTPNPTPPPRPSDPRAAFRLALSRYRGSRLASIRQAHGMAPIVDRIRPTGAAEELTEHLDQSSAVEALASRLPHGSRLALGLMAIAEAVAMPTAGLAHALEVLGVEPARALLPLLELGLMAIEPSPELGPVDDLAEALSSPPTMRLQIVAHPTALRALRPVRPEGRPPTIAADAVGHVRESDGLEPILRLGALWQRTGAEPIRQTQQGTLYKRDRDRILEDPVLAGPIADAMATLPDPGGFWLALARRVGLIEEDAPGQRLTAASPEFWSDNAIHLPQMIATGWLSMRDWQEPIGTPEADEADEPALPYLRPSLMLWLATLDEQEWVAPEDLAGFLASHAPGWDRPNLLPEAEGASPPEPSRRRSRRADESTRGLGLLESVLLGAAYPLGLVRAAEERGSRRRLVQLTPLGRYVLAAGPTPPPRPTFEQFLFVQPNFEVIAYRQGLTPHLVGRLSRFARWTQIGAALELRLTRESILFGLEGGLKPPAMLDVLRRHSQRELPPGVVDAMRTWAKHRERVTYHAAATLIEFGTADDRDRALASWPRDASDTDREPPVAVAERFLLMEDERAIPFDRFKMTGARDYRSPPDICVRVDPDGIAMTLDPARADLMVDAELSRFADEQPSVRSSGGRRFAVTSGSLRRGLERGLTPDDLSDWYERRTGADIPPAVRLLLTSIAATSGQPAPTLRAVRSLILNVPDRVLLDGLLQHPATAPWLGQRLGPTAVAIPEDRLEPLRKTLENLGISIEGA